MRDKMFGALMEGVVVIALTAWYVAIVLLMLADMRLDLGFWFDVLNWSMIGVACIAWVVSIGVLFWGRGD